MNNTQLIQTRAVQLMLHAGLVDIANKVGRVAAKAAARYRPTDHEPIYDSEGRLVGWIFVGNAVIVFEPTNPEEQNRPISIVIKTGQIC